MSSNTSQFAESDPGDDEHIQNRVSYPRKKNSDEAKDNQLQLKTKQTSIDKISSPLLNKKKSCLYNMLDQIVSKENIDEVRLLKISILKFFELKDLTEDDKFNMIIEVLILQITDLFVTQSYSLQSLKSWFLYIYLYLVIRNMSIK